MGIGLDVHGIGRMVDEFLDSVCLQCLTSEGLDRSKNLYLHLHKWQEDILEKWFLPFHGQRWDDVCTTGCNNPTTSKKSMTSNRAMVPISKEDLRIFQVRGVVVSSQTKHTRSLNAA